VLTAKKNNNKKTKYTNKKTKTTNNIMTKSGSNQTSAELSTRMNRHAGSLHEYIKGFFEAKYCMYDLLS
jgi:hypothetical protein